MGELQNNLKNDEINIKEILQILYKYRWSILSTITLMLLFSSIFLYFKTPIYSSSAMIEVKPNGQKNEKNGDFLGGAFSTSSKGKVDKEIEILKTFAINDYTLNKLNFKIQYYVEEGLKKKEVYPAPISIKDLNITDPRILWKMIKVTPHKEGFTLEVQYPLKTQITHLFSSNDFVELNSEKVYPYGKKIKTKYFEFSIEDNKNFKQPLYINLKGSNKVIFEAIIRQNLEVIQINPEAPLILVNYKDNIPQRANTYINTLLKSFIEQSVAEKSKRINRIVKFIDIELNNIKEKVKKSEEKLEKYRIENQAINPTLEAENYIKELSSLEIEIAQNKLKKELIKNLLPFIQTNQEIDAIAPTLVLLEDQTTLELIAKLQEIQIKEVGLKNQYSAKHPELVAVRKEISYAKNKIILNIKNLKTSIDQKTTNFQKLRKLYNQKLKALPTQERTLINLKRDYQIDSKTYNYLLKKKSENDMIKVTILSDYRIVDEAYSNNIPISPKSFFILFAGLILGIVFGILQALIRHNFDDKIHAKSDIEDLTTLPLYGILPELKQNNIKIEVFKNPKSPFSESYRSLRTNLQFLHKETKGKVILLSSTIMGEGKTTTSANLSTIFQMANYKVIVINLDMRKPTLHHYFDVDNTQGMSTYLSSKNSISDIIKPTTYDNLDIITSGPIPPNPSELVLSERLEALINNLKETYDYIVIDSAPLGLVADTMHIMQYSDINLIILREDYSKKSFISDLNKLVKNHSLKHIGLVLNAVNVTSGSYGYGYGYGYGNDND